MVDAQIAADARCARDQPRAPSFAASSGLRARLAEAILQAGMFVVDGAQIRHGTAPASGRGGVAAVRVCRGRSAADSAGNDVVQQVTRSESVDVARAAGLLSGARTA